MSFPDFLKQKDQQNKATARKKKDFRDKCLELLTQIKNYNETKYQELSNTFHTKYDSINIQKKKLMGFYGQLVEELKELRAQAGESVKNVSILPKSVKKTTKKVAQDLGQKAKQTVKKVKSASKDKKEKDEDKKKVAKKTTKKKVTKKTAKKKVAKKTAKKKVAKKTAKKKVAKKTAKKKSKKK